ncbi:MAG: uracil-DNA glycosylase [Bacteroidetes bacterium]|nr:uracil-DNA glycosylase [Bacteroidota bacterium]MCB9042488.1 uracil-DNA glycosylase [Chitinophagales bacterium]
MKPVNPQIHPSWLAVLQNEFEKPYFFAIKQQIIQDKLQGIEIYPPGNAIFNAFNLTAFEQVKVVILGQDPYHGIGQAHGLCFSVPDGVKPPPSLLNIFKEISDDLGIVFPPNKGNLTAWAKQGVFLLNAMLTVRANQAASHQNIGWQQFTDNVIRQLSAAHSGLVFLLWGRFAQNKSQLIDTQKHYILKAAHPSPLSAYNGFLGCKHFSQTNKILASLNKQAIDWQI